ncbi:helix-turn-helix domain-containing protein [Hyalangium sp.]|uniref:winged helix-turn-helix transcriptional regulator n=1 Tax=Hyalangium sp. TaxID=2028555 RepID=UPI002D6E09D0|nr:helix-turn-helix domain-containing protein [Hyalangium sp.]HYI02589.1 helix-turn-helix domain-containing protein [Hyalangium sp.]
MSPSHIQVSHGSCVAAREVLNRVGDKWSVLVVSFLGGGPLRFNELRRTIEGISQRMLTLTLRGLERDGLVTRTLYPSVPPRVDYELTELGRTLLEPVRVLAAWADKHRFMIQEARDRYDQKDAREKSRRATGERARLVGRPRG